MNLNAVDGKGYYDESLVGKLLVTNYGIILLKCDNWHFECDKWGVNVFMNGYY